MSRASRRRALIGVLAVASAGGSGCGTTHTTTHPRPAASSGAQASARAGSATAAAATPPSVAVRAVRIGELPAPVQLPAVTRRGSSLLLLGGLNAADGSVADIVRVEGARARVVGHLPTALHDGAAATVGGRSFFIGGGNAGAGSDRILRVNANGTTAPAGVLPAGASDVEAATIGGTIYVVGGYTGTVPLRTILAVTPGRPARVVGTLPRPLRYAAVAPVAGHVLIAGGTSGTTARREILSFDPGTGRVRRIGLMPHAVTHAAGAALNGRFYVLGGRGDGLDTQRDSIAAVDPATGTVTSAGHLPLALSDLSAASFPGHVTVVGGRDRAGTVHGEIIAIRARRAGVARTRATARAAPAATAAVAVPRAGHIPPLVNAHDVYAAERPGLLSPVVRGDPSLVYVPETKNNTLAIISQRSGKVIRRLPVGQLPQHVVPSWDLRTLWVTNDEGNTLTPIDARTARPGRTVPVRDPYNLYFTADGERAIVVAEAHRALDFRSPHTMRLRHTLSVPQCAGIDHMDFTAGGRFALVSCEFAGRMVVVDLHRERVVKTIELRAGAMPQDVKLSPDGRVFYVADMASDGVWLIDARSWRRLRLQHTGRGAHGLYPSRDSKVLYVSNRGEGTISLISFRTRRPFRKWHLPGGGSPDMGGVSADGRVLWLSGRYDSVVYAISTRTGRLLHRIPVASGPHGMAVWPQPGRYSIGHTGILR